MIKSSENKNNLFSSVHQNSNEMSTYSEGKEEIHEDTKNKSFKNSRTETKMMIRNIHIKLKKCYYLLIKNI